MVNGASPGPAPAAHARASNSRLTRSSWRTWPQRKLRRKVPRVDGALTMQSRTPAVSTGTQRIGVVDAVAASQRGGDQRHYLVAGVGPARRITQVQALLYQLGKTEVQSQGGWEEQAGIVHQAVIVEGDLDAVEVVAWQHLSGAPSLGLFCCYKTIIPDSKEHPLATSGR